MVMQAQQFQRTDGARIVEQFERIGAKANVRVDFKLDRDVRFGIDAGSRGEMFEISFGERAELKIVDIQPKLRQILIADAAGDPTDARHFLCGRDESHWFVAQVPAQAGGLKSVAEAFEALKPGAVLESQARHALSDEEKLTRQNAAYKRQGEWFFVPRSKLIVPKDQVLRREPVRRPRGKAHYLEYAFRKGGRPMMVCDAFPEGITLEDWRTLVRKDYRKARAHEWTQMQADPRLFARGMVTHADHKPMYLQQWHEVFISREMGAMDGSVQFLD